MKRLAPQTLALWVLLMQGGLLLALLDPFHAPPVRQPDTVTYIHFGSQSFLEALGYMRTLFYPMLLYYGRQLMGDLAWLPAFQHLAQIGAVALFWFGLTRYGFNPWVALITASPLLYGEMIFFFGSSLLTDSLGLSLAVASLGALLLVLARPGCGWSWAGWGLSLFLAYQTRPTYQFLVPLGIGLGVLLWWLRRGVPGALPAIATRGVVLRLVGVALVPWLLFCGVRGVLVGEFALVSGSNVIAGFASPLLDEATIARLSEPLRPLAREIRLEREKRNMTPPFTKHGWMRYGPWVAEYDAIISQVALPAAMKQTNQDWVQSNQLLTALGREVIRLHPQVYMKWLATAFTDSIGIALRHQRVLQLCLVLLLPLCAVHLFRAGLRRRDPSSAPVVAPPALDLSWELAVVGVIALSFYLVGTLTVILVIPPYERFVFATAHVLPALGALLLLACVGRMVPERLLRHFEVG